MTKKKKSLLVHTAVNRDGSPVYARAFQFYETHGLPLDVLFTCFKERGAIPDWIDFYKSAREAGMEHTRILSKLEEAISDSFGKEWSDIVISRLDSLFKAGNEQ